MEFRYEIDWAMQRARQSFIKAGREFANSLAGLLRPVEVTALRMPILRSSRWAPLRHGERCHRRDARCGKKVGLWKIRPTAPLRRSDV